MSKIVGLPFTLRLRRRDAGLASSQLESGAGGGGGGGGASGSSTIVVELPKQN